MMRKSTLAAILTAVFGFSLASATKREADAEEARMGWPTVSGYRLVKSYGASMNDRPVDYVDDDGRQRVKGIPPDYLDDNGRETWVEMWRNPLGDAIFIYCRDWDSIPQKGVRRLDFVQKEGTSWERAPPAYCLDNSWARCSIPATSYGRGTCWIDTDCSDQPDRIVPSTDDLYLPACIDHIINPPGKS